MLIAPTIEENAWSKYVTVKFVCVVAAAIMLHNIYFESGTSFQPKLPPSTRPIKNRGYASTGRLTFCSET